MKTTRTQKALMLGSAIALSAFLAACTTTPTSALDQATATTASAVVSNPGSTIQLNNQSVSIMQAGTYTLSGKISNGQILVDAGEGAEVTLKLAGVEISSQTSSAILAKSGKVTIELVSGSSNQLSDGSYAETAEENATIYAEEALTIDGEGSLIITANGADAITSKDQLTIADGKLQITATDDALRGKDGLTIEKGEILIQSGGDGLKSDDETKGTIVINGGNITISSSSDGAQAYQALTINGGTLNILQSEEGLESQLITINEGNIAIKASDDGINISDSSSSTSTEGMTHRNGTASGRKLVINGGTVTVDADGDGLDSNGAIEMNGGEVSVYGPTNDGNAALDYDEIFTMNGGTLLAFGSNGMAMNVSAGTQNAVLIGLSSQQSANSTFTLLDASGNAVLEASPSKAYSSVLVSSVGLKLNSNYTYSINGTKAGTFTLSQSKMTTGTAGGMMWGGMWGRMGGTMPQMTAEQQTQMEQMRTLMDKQRSGQTLTSEEQALLAEFEANRPQRR